MVIPRLVGVVLGQGNDVGQARSCLTVSFEVKFGGFQAVIKVMERAYIRHSIWVIVILSLYCQRNQCGGTLSFCHHSTHVLSRKRLSFSVMAPLSPPGHQIGFLDTGLKGHISL